MAARNTCRSSRNTASRADFSAPIKLGTANVARMPMIAMTIISSISVKPASDFRSLFTNSSSISRAPFPVLFPNPCLSLPVRVLGAIQSRGLRLGIHVEDALPAERIRCRVILHRAHAPFCFAGHGIDGNAAQKADFLALHIDSLHQRVEIRRTVLSIYFGLERAAVGRILVVVDGVAHLPQIAAKLSFAIALDLETRDRHRRRGKDRQDSDRDDQLDQGQAALGALPDWPLAAHRPSTSP